MTTAPADSAGTLAPAYGDKVIAVEATGSEPVPEAERHGGPLQLVWTWASPNIEFATVFIGVIAVLFFGLSFWQATAAIVLGTALGAITQGVLSLDGPRFGVPQMVIGRLSFGHRGNILPAAANGLVAGVGWFAVNSVSAAFALNTLTGLRPLPSLLLVVAAEILIGFIGHNFVHAFERYAFPALAVIFLLAGVWTFKDADLGGAARAAASAASCSPSARPGATRPAGTRTPRTTRAISPVRRTSSGRCSTRRSACSCRSPWWP